MPKQFIIFTDEELKKLLDGSPVQMEASEYLPDLMFVTEDGYKKFLKFFGETEYQNT